MEVELKESKTMGIFSAPPIFDAPQHGFFRFKSPPLAGPPFNYIKKAEPKTLIQTCWGYCQNGIPEVLPAIDDFFGVAVIDRNQQRLLQGYYVDKKIPAYEFISWYTKNDVVMPTRDLNLICFVGYYDITGDILHYTDSRDFTIKAGTPFSLWWLLIPLTIIPILIKLKDKFK